MSGRCFSGCRELLPLGGLVVGRPTVAGMNERTSRAWRRVRLGVVARIGQRRFDPGVGQRRVQPRHELVGIDPGPRPTRAASSRCLAQLKEASSWA
ncbi:MAG TPA: hypothetical protein VNK04_02835 [Gemmataceae bacterium]|nr:hypothetical protein [Gemmataceae bacterium]